MTVMEKRFSLKLKWEYIGNIEWVENHSELAYDSAPHTCPNCGHEDSNDEDESEYCYASMFGYTFSICRRLTGEWVSRYMNNDGEEDECSFEDIPRAFGWCHSKWNHILMAEVNKVTRSREEYIKENKED